MLDTLTIIYDRRGYRKRCNNSQEDWFRRYDGEFLALCINQVREVTFYILTYLMSVSSLCVLPDLIFDGIQTQPISYWDCRN